MTGNKKHGEHIDMEGSRGNMPLQAEISSCTSLLSWCFLPEPPNGHMQRQPQDWRKNPMQKAGFTGRSRKSPQVVHVAMGSWNFNELQVERSNSFGAEHWHGFYEYHEHQLLNSQSAKLHVCMNDVAAAMVHDNLNAA